MRAVVTGGRGFVGRWLTEHLESQGDDVSAFDAEIDVTDEDAVFRALASSGPEVVYHLAARTHVGQSWHSPLDVVRVNVLGTASVLAAARRAVPSAVVLVVSSAEVYGALRPEDLPAGEDTAVRPVTPYAASKAAAEAIALQAARGFGQGVVVVRPFNHVGPGQAESFAVPALARRILDARRAGTDVLRVGTVSTRRDFTDVRDVVRAYRLLVADGEPGSVYNVCSGRDVEIAEIARRLMVICGADLELVTDPDLVRPVDAPVLRGDPARLEATTGWKPEIPIDDTLRDVVAELERGDQAPGRPA